MKSKDLNQNLQGENTERASGSSSPLHGLSVGLVAPCSHPNHASNKFSACRRDSHTPRWALPAAGHGNNPYYCYQLTPGDNPVTWQQATRSPELTQLFLFIYLLLFCFGFFYQTIQHQARLPRTCRDDDRNSWSQRDDAFDRGAPGGTRRTEHGDERIPFSSASRQLASWRYRKSVVHTGLPPSCVHAEKLLWE